MQTTEENRPSTGGAPRSLRRATTTLTVLPVPFVAVAAIVLVLVAPVVAVVVVVLSAALCAAWAIFVRRTIAGAEDRVLDMLGAADVSQATHARLHNVVEGLCLTLGMSKPRLLSFESAAIVGCAVSGPHSAGSLVVSRGLTESLDRMEHEAVVAHLLSRLRSGDILVRTLSIACGDAMSSFGISGLVASILGKSDELSSLHQADASACGVTRYPPGLMSALSKIAAGPVIDVAGVRQTAALWVADDPLGDAVGASGVSRVGEVRLTADERIELLKEI